MSVLIKGMAMPIHCSVCKFFDHGDCELLPYGDYIDDKHKRRDNCPLIELPPHGRLIDADALIAKVREELLSPHNKKGVLETMGAMFRDVLDAPTIIESEEEDG